MSLNKLRKSFGSAIGTFIRILRIKNVSITIIVWTLFGLIGPLFWQFSPDYIRKLGGTPRIIGLINAATAFTSMLVMIPGGYLADKRGRKGVMVWGTFLASLPCFLGAFSWNWQVYLISSIMLAAFSNVYVPAMHAILRDSLPSDMRAFTLSIVDSISWSLPYIISSVIGGYFYEKYGVTALRASLFGIGVVYLVSGFLRTRLEETIVSNSEKEKICLRDLLDTLINAFKGIPETFMWLKGALTHLIALDITISMIWGFTDSFWLIYALDIIEISRFQWGIMEASWSLMMLIVSPIAGFISDRRGRLKVMIISPLMLSTLFIAFTLIHGFLPALIIWILWGIPEALLYPSFEALWVDLVKSEKRARILTIRSLTGGTINALSAALGGYIYEFNPRYPFYIASLAWLFAFLVLISLKELINS